MHGLSFQQLVVRQPIKMGGMGLKSLVQIRSAAFGGSVEQFVPELGTSAGQCPKLSICLLKITSLLEGFPWIPGGESPLGQGVG